MRILEVVHGLRTASGVATFVRELSDALFAQGESVAIAMCRPETDNWMPPKGGESVVALTDALTQGGWDVVHVHGLWDREIRLAVSWAIRHRVPLVWSPHGMLAPWALKFHWWKKCLPWHAYLKRLLHRASAFHVTSEKEAEWVRDLGFKVPTILLPLGTHVVGMTPPIDRRAAAERKVAEWLMDVDEASFESALVNLVEVKSAVGEYRFKKPEDMEFALEGALRFFREFARKIIPLSDGRYVYFAPDARAKLRNASNAISWAEYAFYAVSSSGKLLDGKNFRERLYNPMKTADLPYLEGVIRNERCMYRLVDACPENDAVIFVGQDEAYGRLEIVTRLDQFGNAEANLGEVTVIAQHRRKENPPPRNRPFTEVVEAVAKHQAAGFSPSTTAFSVSYSADMRKGQTVNQLPTTNQPTWFDLSDASSIWNMNPIVIGKAPVVPDKKAVKECFRNFGTVVNCADGARVVFPAASAGKMLYQSGMEIGRVVSSFKRLFEGARLAWREREEKMEGHKYHFNVKSYANYVNKFSLDGELYFIRFTIREIGTALGVHASTMSEVRLYEIKTDGASTDSILENPEDGPNAPFTDMIPYSQRGVNVGGKKFIDWKLTAFFKTATTTLLFVGRIHPVKGLENLVRAVAQVVKDRTDLRVRLVGTDDAGFQAQLERLIGELSVGAYIAFPGPRYEAELTREFVDCDFSILPSFTENFGGVVIDSLAAGRPVIASRATPWEVLEKERCGLWVENSPEELARAIRKMMEMSPEERRVMGERGRRFVEANYAWTAVAEKMRKAYEVLKG